MNVCLFDFQSYHQNLVYLKKVCLIIHYDFEASMAVKPAATCCAGRFTVRDEGTVQHEKLEGRGGGGGGAVYER
jgi:hypothetical protein